MRLHSARPDLILVWYLPTILIYSAIVIFLPQYLMYFSKFNTFLLLITFLIIITPLGNYRFGNKEITFIQFIKKWAMIFLIELAISFCYVGTQIAVINRDNALNTSSHAYIWSTLIAYHWQDITLYPWTLCGFLTIFLVWTYHKLQYKPTTFACGLKPLFNKKFTPDIIISIDFFFRGAFIFFTITTITYSLISCVYSISSLFHIALVNQLTLKNLVIFVVIQQFFGSKQSKKMLATFRETGRSLGFSLFVIAVIFVILFFILNFVTDILAKSISIFNIVTNLPDWITRLSVNNHYLILFSWAWLFTVSFGAAYYFVKIMEGWRVRTILMSLLILPLMINGVWIVITGGGGNFSNLYLNNLINYLASSNILPLMSFALLIIFLTLMKDINGLFRLSIVLYEQYEKLMLTNVMRGVVFGSTLMTFVVYLGLQNILLLIDLILILPCVTLVFMAGLAYFKGSIKNV